MAAMILICVLLVFGVILQSRGSNPMRCKPRRLFFLLGKTKAFSAIDHSQGYAMPDTGYGMRDERVES
jgi:hypothetical protein